jgi:DNA-binding protein HU-beta
MKTSHDLITHIADTADVPYTTAKRCLAATIDAIASIPTNETLTLRNFGTFKRYVTPARAGHNPATGQPMTVSAREVLRFTASKKLIRPVE